MEAPTGLIYLAFQQHFGAKIRADDFCTLLADLSQPTEVDPMDTRQANAEAEPESTESAPDPSQAYAIGALKCVVVSCLLRRKHDKAHVQWRHKVI